MADVVRPQPTLVTVCDLCGEVIPEASSEERGSLMWGYGSNHVTRRTKYVWFKWPSSDWRRKHSVEERMKPENQQRNYDFHAECILKLVEANLYTPREATNG